MRRRGLTRVELMLAIAGSFVWLGVAAMFGDGAGLVLLVLGLVVLGGAAAVMGVDSRAGGDWSTPGPP